MLLGDRRHCAARPDSVTAHHERLLLSVLVKERRPEADGVKRPELEDVPELDGWLLDEPSAGLDPIVSAGLDELILFLKRSFGMTILVVTHELKSAFHIADRVAMLYRGRLIAADSKEKFARNAHPHIRQFLDSQPDAPPSVAAEEFIASYLRGPKDDY